ncbi:MAG: transglycosylase domain-containing protein [Nitriliruptoraceae bacterium]
MTRSGRAVRGKSATPQAVPGARWWRRRLLLAASVMASVALASFGLLGFYLVVSTPPLPHDIANHASVLVDVDGKEVGGLSADVLRSDVALSSLPDYVPQAVMAIEDRNFYDHRGVSLSGIARALFTNVRAGTIEQGGSTITQQYIKNAALSPERTYRRKVEEAALAIKLEQAFSKDEILEFYLNTSYWGRGTTGIDAAAQSYFDKSATALSPNEAATLAAMLASPENLDPWEDPEPVDVRRRVALAGMLEQDWIDQDEHDELVDEGLPTVMARAPIDLGPNGYYFDAVRRVLARHPDLDDGQLFRGLRIHTHLDPRLQAEAQTVLAAAISDGPTDTGAIVTVDPATGGIRALVGGPDVMDQLLNAALVSHRQVGSSFKAFTLQAFVEAGWSLQSVFNAPATIEIDGHEYGNYGGTGFGPRTVHQATLSSINTVYLQMQEQIGRDRVVEAAHRAGLPRDKSEEVFATQRNDGPVLENYAGLTLGQNDFTAVEMASAFGTYAADGKHALPQLVSRIESRDGDVLWEADARPEQTVDRNVARVVTDALRGVIESGTGQAADIGRPAAGKTGTTNEGRNVWFVGYVPQLSTAVWLGNLDNSPIEADDATGGGLAAPVWAEYMGKAVEGIVVEEFGAPDLSGLEVLREAVAGPRQDEDDDDDGDDDDGDDDNGDDDSGDGNDDRRDGVGGGNDDDGAADDAAADDGPADDAAADDGPADDGPADDGAADDGAADDAAEGG